jgi:uncharacterized protein with NRDE domain
MCLLALFSRVVEDAPLVVGANREEFYARGGEPPRLLDGPVRAVAGVDPTAGGTWLGLNEHGVVIAVTNRAQSRPPERPRSRGLLARDLLGCPSASAAAEEAKRALDSGHYAGCNIVCADSESATVLHAGDWLRIRPLPPGIHVIANRDVNDASDRRVLSALDRLERQRYGCSQQIMMALEELCAGRGDDGPPMCLRAADRGTVSSSIMAVRRPLASGVYLHAQGPPDVTPYADYSNLLRELTV